jgi:tetratricopeptide (TPR) repeat protein
MINFLRTQAKGIPTAIIALMLGAGGCLTMGTDAAWAADATLQPAQETPLDQLMGAERPASADAQVPKSPSDAATDVPPATPSDRAQQPHQTDGTKGSSVDKEVPAAAQDVPPGQETQAKPEPPKEPKGTGQTSDKQGDDPVGLNKQAKVLEKEAASREALEKYQSALKRAEEKNDKKSGAAALDGLARVSHQLGQDKEALGYVRRSIKAHQELKNARARSLALLLEGRILMKYAKHAAALESFEEALKILPESEAAEKPKLLEDTAICKIRLGKHSEGLATYNRLIVELEKGAKRKEAARVHLLMGDIQVSRSDYRGAGTSFKKAEAIYRALGLKKELGETLFRSAYLEQLSGNVKAAQKGVEEGNSLLSQQDRRDFDALPLFVSGLAAVSEGNFTVAVKSLSAAIGQYEKNGDQTMAARVRLALGNAENDRSQMKSALEHAGQALVKFRALSDQGGEAGALRLIATVYLRQGFLLKALEYAQEALAISKKINEPTETARTRILLAEIHTGLGDVDFAAKLLKEAVEGSAGNANRGDIGQVRLAVARLHFAREAFDKTLQVAQAARKDFAEINQRRCVADCDHLIGLVHEMQGERNKSFALFDQALKEHRAMRDRFGEARDLTALGVHYKNLGDHERALTYFREALDLRKGIGDRRGHAASLANIGNVLKHRNQIPEALQNLEQALEIYREVSDKKGQADILTNLGNVHAASRSQPAALEKFSEALALHREIHDIRGVATDLASTGSLYLSRGDLENAAKYLEEAAKVNKRLNNPRGEVAILAELAMLQHARKNTARALSLLQQSLKLARSTDDARAVSSILLKTSMVLRDAGNYEKALVFIREALGMMKQQGDRTGELWALGEIGIIQAKAEDYEDALTNLHRALELRAELGLVGSQSREIDFYLGEIYEGFKDFERALEHYHKALAMAQVTVTDKMLGQLYHRIGTIYYQIDDYSRAKEFFEDAVRIHTETNDVEMQKVGLIRLGDILSKLGDSEGALKRQLKALAITRESGDRSTEARTLTRIGTHYQMLGRPRVALEYYKEALEKRTQLGEQRGVNENLLQIALVSSIMGDFDSAVSDLKKAFEIAHCSEDRGMLWKAYFIMGRALQGQNRMGEALESYRKAIAILEAREAEIIEESDEDNFIFGGKTALFETTLSVLMKLARKDPDGAYDQQALAIVDKLKTAEFQTTLARTNVEKFSDVPEDVLIKEKSLRLSLRKLTERLTEELSKANPDKSQIAKFLEERRTREAAFKKLKESLVKDCPAYAALRYPRPVSVHMFQKQILEPDEAILEYMVTRSRTYLFVLDKNRFQTFSIDYSLQDLERDVHAVIRPLYRADTQASWDPSLAYKIYAKMVKPAENFLAAKKNVVVIPHGPLSSLPFEVLVSSEEHADKRFWSAADRPKYLLEKYAFCYAPTTSLLSHLRTRKHDSKPGWTMVAFGDAVFPDAEKKGELNSGAEKLLSALDSNPKERKGPKIRPLGAPRKEVSEIVKVVGGPVQTYFGPQATETLFKKADLGRYAYVHLATHGLMLGGVGRLSQQPAVIFSLSGDHENDGFLQMGEVFGLSLNAELVVLSSCLNSGKDLPGNPNGLLGLARAFLFAGADSVILSMWPVNDEHTANLFVEMYRRLRSGSKAQALREAKITVLNGRGTSHPYYWAPFILAGQWQMVRQPGFNTVDHQKMRFKGLSTWRKIFSN